MMLKDRFEREMRSLRVSVTDRCNLKCRYCMPVSGCPTMPQTRQLSNAELLRLCGLLVGQGIRRIKLTGGEPLLRPGLAGLVRELSNMKGVEEVSMTTNGTLLKRHARSLASAGLARVTVSLDSLDPIMFRHLTRGGLVEEVLEGLHEAEQAGLGRIKLNAVVLRDWNFAEVVDLSTFALARGWELRFIEYMPLVKEVGLPTNAGVSMQELKERLEKALGGLLPLPRRELEGPAEMFSLKDGRGRLGFISAMTRRFCDACDRLRLGADGFLRLCMAHSDGVELGQLLRQGASDEQLVDAIHKAVWEKPAGHGMDVNPSTAESMAGIGG
jgi:cyclic pyranopterin phosphate synthase